ncbi:MAG TPA: polyprenyl synthetase family protein [Chloroflexota bacterium]|nr:polyprenyl synthetase family protein [Chloroflexota bacterium]
MHSSALRLFTPIEADLLAVEERIERVTDIEPPILRDALRHVMLAPGKRIRPALTIACGRLFRDATASLHSMAAAVEYLHTATLIHDDVVDQPSLRRGAPALYSLVGNSVALLAGDYLFAQAAATASETNNLRIMRLFAESVMTLCAGQIDECARIGDERQEIDRDSYYRTIDAKTAALFVLACHAGAILGEASLAQTEALRRYGRLLGLAFQIVDDVLDLVGDESAMGKPVGSDLRQGLVTLPVIYLRDEIAEDLLRQAFSDDGAKEQAIEQIADRARESNAVRRAYAEARHLCDEAAAELEALPKGSHRELLWELTRTVIDRPS